MVWELTGSRTIGTVVGRVASLAALNNRYSAVDLVFLRSLPAVAISLVPWLLGISALTLNSTIDLAEKNARTAKKGSYEWIE